MAPSSLESVSDIEARAVLVRRGALREGHFLLSSGLHSPVYLQSQAVFQFPEEGARLARGLAARFATRKPGVTAVLGPALGAIVLAHEVARALGARTLFAERGPSGKMELRRGQTILASDLVLVVENVVTTGGSVREVLDLVRALAAPRPEGADDPVVGVGALVDRRPKGAANPFGVWFEALARIDAETYAADDCPLCAAGAGPAVSPGSRHLA